MHLRTHPAPYRAALRSAVDAALRSDADFDRFCIDFFPDIHQRFTLGMERTQKVNLLLLHADPSGLSQLLAQEANARSSPAPSQSWSLAVVVCSAVLVAAIGWWLQGQGRSVRLVKEDFPVQEGRLPQLGAVVRRITLRTTPAGATVYDLASGKQLGTTPLLLPDEQASSLKICIRREGFKDIQGTLSCNDILQSNDIKLIMRHLTDDNSYSLVQVSAGIHFFHRPCQVPVELIE